MVKMNKKGGFNVMTFLTNTLIFAIIVAIIFAIWGTSGGFSAIIELGKLTAKVPGFVWLGLGITFLIMKIIGK